MSWLHPTYLWSLAAVPLAILLFWWAVQKRRQALERFGEHQLLQQLMAAISPRRRQWKALLVVAAVGLMGAALAGPRMGTQLREVERQGIDVVLALDVSASMQAQDVRPSRLRKAKLEIEKFSENLSGDRLGLVLFAGDAFLQCPLTLDYSAFKLYLDVAAPSAIPTPGTNIRAALQTALQAFEEQDADSDRTRAIVIISDGEDHEQRAQALIEKARERNIETFTVGVGGTKGAPIPVYSQNGRQIGHKKDNNGETVHSRLKETYLRELSGADRYYRIGPTQSSFSELQTVINRLERTSFASRSFETYKEQFQWPLAAALLLLVLEPVVTIYRGKKS